MSTDLTDFWIGRLVNLRKEQAQRAQALTEYEHESAGGLYPEIYGEFRIARHRLSAQSQIAITLDDRGLQLYLSRR